MGAYYDGIYGSTPIGVSSCKMDITLWRGSRFQIYKTLQHRSEVTVGQDFSFYSVEHICPPNNVLPFYVFAHGVELYSSCRLVIRPLYTSQEPLDSPPLFDLEGIIGEGTLDDLMGGPNGTLMTLLITGAFIWSIPPSITATFGFTQASYELECTGLDDPTIKDKLLYGKITILGEANV